MNDYQHKLDIKFSFFFLFDFVTNFTNDLNSCHHVSKYGKKKKKKKKFKWGYTSIYLYEIIYTPAWINPLPNSFNPMNNTTSPFILLYKDSHYIWTPVFSFLLYRLTFYLTTPPTPVPSTQAWGEGGAQGCIRREKGTPTSRRKLKHTVETTEERYLKGKKTFTPFSF